jgi:hypothetical protein
VRACDVRVCVCVCVRERGRVRVPVHVCVRGVFCNGQTSLIYD